MKDQPNPAQPGWTPLPRRSEAVRAEPETQTRSLIDSKYAYTISEVGELLGFCRATIYKLIAAGELRTVNLSDRAPRVLRDELLRFLDRKAGEATAMENKVRRNLGLPSVTG